MSSHHRSRTLFLGFALAALIPLQAACGAPGGDFPSKAITVVSPFAAGGSNDIVARALADATTKHLGQPINVTNVAGGGGAIGAAEVAQAKPDGYTLILMGFGPATTIPFQTEVPYKSPGSFTPIMMVSAFPFILVSRADSPIKDFKSLVEQAKAKPGALTFGSPGQGSGPHLAVERLAKAAGIKLSHVPFKASAEGVTAMLGGQIDMVGAQPPDVIEFVKAGKVLGLLTFSGEPLPDFPGMPTAKSLGFDFVLVGWTAMAGPAGLQDGVLKKLHDGFKKGMDEPSFKTTLERGGLPITYMNTADFTKKWLDDSSSNEKLINELGLGIKK